MKKPMKKRVLIIDNDPLFLEQRQEALEQFDPDYVVTTAISLESGRRLMSEEYFHVVTIDVGMSDRESDKDTTGLQLVHDPKFAHLVKVVITGPHNDVTLSNAAMSRPEGSGLPPAVAYLLKEEGPEVMYAAIETALRRDCGIDPAMDVDLPSRGFAGDLVGMLEPDAPGDRLFERGEELTDVLRKVFKGHDRVRVVRRQWHYGARAALVVTAWRGATSFHEYLVIVGLQEEVTTLYAAYCRLMPERAPRGHAQLIHSLLQPHTLRYAGVVFELPSARLDQLRSLRDFYNDSNPNDVRECVRGLVTEGLKPWSHHTQLLGVSEHADRTLRAQAGLTDDSAAQLVQAIQQVGRVAESQNWANALLHDGQLIIRPLAGAEYRTPDPVQWLARPGPEAFGHPLSTGVSCGVCPPDTILVAPNRRSWLTDYGWIDDGPLLSSLASLEAAVLFELHVFPDLPAFADAYQTLLGFPDLGQTLGAPTPDLRKPFGAIQQIRQQASRGGYGGDMEAYQRSVFYHATRHLLNLSPEELHDAPLRGLCLCLGLGLLAERLSAAAKNLTAPKGLVVHEDTKTVWFKGRQVSMTPRAYRFLLYLWQRRDKCCPKDEIITGCAGPTYSPTYAHELVKETRRALGPSAELYLVTCQGGYTLYPDGRPETPPSL